MRDIKDIQYYFDSIGMQETIVNIKDNKVICRSGQFYILTSIESDMEEKGY